MHCYALASAKTAMLLCPEMSKPSQSNPVEKLSERQKEVLRLVLGHMTTQDIAHHLKIEPSAVDGRIREAIRKLDVDTRKQAALLLHENEIANDQTDQYQIIGYQSSHLSKPSKSDRFDASSDDRSPADTTKTISTLRALFLLERTNRLTSLQRIWFIFWIIFISSAVAGSIARFAELLTELVGK